MSAVHLHHVIQSKIKKHTLSLIFFVVMVCMYMIVKTRAVSVNALIYAINAAAINAIKYFNAINAT